jgi:ribonuclease G
MPGMQAAFVDIGLERAAFLHANDICAHAGGSGEGEEPAPATPTPPIAELVREGQE